MDARQNFYNHNRYLFRLLVGSTVAFVAIIVVLWWQERDRGGAEAVPVSALRQFSAEAAQADVTRDYAFGARHIHDIESYPALRAIFFERGLSRELGEATLAERLAEVAAAQSLGTTSEREHVYHTSYYIGNLLVLPGQTLHALLLERPVAETALLLDTALADVRAGVVKLQGYYDVAPPSWYLAGGTGALFYPTPSFPSLTVSEAAIVLYMLATVDPANARYYERALTDFADQVWRTGVHFRSDIEYALDLAAAYATIMAEVPEYQALIAAAESEWTGVSVENDGQAKTWSRSSFIAPDFPVPAQFAVTQEATGSFAVDATEQLAGQLRLTLVDTRLTPPLTRLYAYDLVAGGQVLPSALDLTKRQYPDLSVSSGYAAYQAADRYVFASGETVGTSRRGSYQLASSSLFWRDKQTLTKMEISYPVTPREVVMDRSGSEILFMSDGDIWRAAVTDGSVSEKITRGRSPLYLTEGVIGFVRDGAVYRKDLKTGLEVQVSGVPALGERGFIAYDEMADRLLVVDVVLDPRTLVPKSAVEFYRLETAGDELLARRLYTLTLSDRVVSSVLLSPGARYLALMVSEGEYGREPEVLLFDIFNGIIQKEIDLTPFAPEPARLDGWTLL